MIGFFFTNKHKIHEERSLLFILQAVSNLFLYSKKKNSQNGGGVEWEAAKKTMTSGPNDGSNCATQLSFLTLSASPSPSESSYEQLAARLTLPSIPCLFDTSKHTIRVPMIKLNPSTRSFS